LDFQCKGKSCELLSVGTRVRIPFDEPREAYGTNRKLAGRFRATDLRFDPRIRTIAKVMLNPGQPPMYVVSPIREGRRIIDPLVAYTRNEL